MAITDNDEDDKKANLPTKGDAIVKWKAETVY